MALSWLKTNCSEASAHKTYNMDEKTFRQWKYYIVRKISELGRVSLSLFLLPIHLSHVAVLQVKFENRFKEASRLINKIFFSLDGTDFPINEPSPFSKIWFSHKFNGPAIRYEIGISLRTSDIVWAFGGVKPGDFPDLELARSCVVDMIDDGELIVADNGYNDSWVFLNDRKGSYEPQDTAIRQYLARHESVNKRIRDFKILSDKYKGKLSFHPRIFHACVNLVQIQIENGNELAESSAF